MFLTSQVIQEAGMADSHRRFFEFSSIWILIVLIHSALYLTFLWASLYLKVLSETSLVQKVGKALLRRVIFESIVLCVFAFFVSSASSLGDPYAITTTTIYSPRDLGYRTKSIMYRTRSNTFKFGRQLLPFFPSFSPPPPLIFLLLQSFSFFFIPKETKKS